MLRNKQKSDVSKSGVSKSGILKSGVHSDGRLVWVLVGLSCVMLLACVMLPMFSDGVSVSSGLDGSRVIAGSQVIAGGQVGSDIAFSLGELPHRELPSLQIWGKIFSGLLLGTIGVAYLVWRRPVMQAQAILETSPLGTGSPSPPLIDWSLFIRTCIVVEATLGVSLWAFSAMLGRGIAMLDVLGVLGAGVIVSFVAHLLLLGRGERVR